MKHGWIQVENNGGKEELAPKTMADLVYVDENKEKTVKDALAEGFVAVFEHSVSTNADDERVHNFEGPSDFVGMGRALMTETVRPSDKVTVNGQNRDAFVGGVALNNENPRTIPQGFWETFVVSKDAVNFKMGGTDQNYQVIAVPSVESLPVDEIQNTFALATDVAPKKTFFQGSAPVASEVGDVWIETSTGTQIGVNLGKGDEIHICPIHAAQWDGVAWQLKEMRLYQNGSWKTLGTMLYDAGQMVTAYEHKGYNDNYGTTGGWKGGYWILEENRIKLAGNNSYHTAHMDWYLNLTEYRRARIDVEVIKGGLTFAAHNVAQTNGTTVAATAATKGRYELWLDLSNINGLKYIKLFQQFSVDTEVYIHQVYLEYK